MGARDTAPSMPADVTRHGDSGYWELWWQALHPGDGSRPAPLEMTIAIPYDGDFASRQWLADLDPAVMEYALAAGLIRGRVIVPPGAIESRAHDLVDVALAHGVDVRVLAMRGDIVLYNDATAVVTDRRHEPVAYTMTRHPEVVAPLRARFETAWAAAVPWRRYLVSTRAVLHLLACGWSDRRIAEATGVSLRTVTRRISAAIETAGVRTRFQLGMLYARDRVVSPTDVP